MSMLLIENADGVLWLSGNVMPSEEKRLNEELRQYIKATSKDSRIVDMSAVKYISSSAAKTLLTIAQEANARGGKLKVRSSIPVVRTLSLLGAETWCDVEPCREPNRRPGSTTVGSTRIVPVSPTAQKGDSNTRLVSVDPSAAKRDSNTRLVSVDPSAAKRDSNTRLTPVSSTPTDLPPTLDDMEVKEVLGERRSTVGLNAPGTSIVRSSVGQTEVEAALVSSAAAKAGLPLVNDDVDLPDDQSPLKKLVVMKTYTFQTPGLKSDITGKVLARIGGPWILIDTHGAKKMLDITKVAIIDILA